MNSPAEDLVKPAVGGRASTTTLIAAFDVLFTVIGNRELEGAPRPSASLFRPTTTCDKRKSRQGKNREHQSPRRREERPGAGTVEAAEAGGHQAGQQDVGRRVAGGGSPPPARHFAPVAALPRPPRAALKVDLAIDHRAYLGAMGRTPAPSSAGPSTMHPASYAPPAPHRPLTYDAALGPARVVHVHTWEDDYTESSPVEVMLRQLRMRGLLHPPKQKEAPPGGRPIGAISVPLAKVHAARVRWVGWPLTYAPMDGWMDGWIAAHCAYGRTMPLCVCECGQAGAGGS